MPKCSNVECRKPLTADEIIDEEIEDGYVCRGEFYDELEAVPSERRDECTHVGVKKSFYECDACGTETIIEQDL